MTQRSTSGGALVVGGAHGSLGVARSLGRRGIPVFYLTHDHQLPRFSRYTRSSAAWAGPERSEAADDLLELGRRHRLEGYVLIPGGDAEVRLIAQNRAKLSSTFGVTTADWETARWALDKRLTYERAASLGIDHPWSFYPRNSMDVARLDCRFPVVLKPTTRWDVNAFTLAKAWRIDDRDALLSRYSQALALAGENGVVLQEMIPGDGSTQYSYAAVWDRGQPVASLVARRTRQYPIDFGYSSTLVQSIEFDEIERAAVRFLKSLDYSGLVEVEFKYDCRDRRYKLLDVNVRSWTWISLGGIAGVDFPYILWRLANGETVTPVRGRPGATWMYFSRDVVSACQEMAARQISPMTYLSSYRPPLTFATFSMDDPVPGIIDLPLLAWRLITRRLPLMASTFQSSLLKLLNGARSALLGKRNDHKAF